MSGLAEEFRDPADLADPVVPRGGGSYAIEELVFGDAQALPACLQPFWQHRGILLLRLHHYPSPP